MNFNNLLYLNRYLHGYFPNNLNSPYCLYRYLLDNLPNNLLLNLNLLNNLNRNLPDNLNVPLYFSGHFNDYLLQALSEDLDLNLSDNLYFNLLYGLDLLYHLYLFYYLDLDWDLPDYLNWDLSDWWSMWFLKGLWLWLVDACYLLLGCLSLVVAMLKTLLNSLFNRLSHLLVLLQVAFPLLILPFIQIHQKLWIYQLFSLRLLFSGGYFILIIWCLYFLKSNLFLLFCAWINLQVIEDRDLNEDDFLYDLLDYFFDNDFNWNL